MVIRFYNANLRYNCMFKRSIYPRAILNTSLISPIMDYTQLYVDMCHCPNNTLNANPTNKIIIPLKCTWELVGTYMD